MASMHSHNEGARLRIAIDLLQRSDACAVTEPHLARYYLRQAYKLGHHSSKLRKSIVKKRIQMIVQQCNQRRIDEILKAFPLSGRSRHRRVKKAGLIIFLFLVATFLLSTPINELSNPSVQLAAHIVDAPL